MASVGSVDSRMIISTDPLSEGGTGNAEQVATDLAAHAAGPHRFTASPTLLILLPMPMLTPRSTFTTRPRLLTAWISLTLFSLTMRA